MTAVGQKSFGAPKFDKQWTNHAMTPLAIE